MTRRSQTVFFGVSERSAGASDGSILVQVVDPTKLTGDNYEVSVNEGFYYWDTTQTDALWMMTTDPSTKAEEGFQTHSVIYWSVMNTSNNIMLLTF